MASKKQMRRVGGWNERVGERQEPAPEAVGKHRAKKDTKRWCKGVVGREHVLETVIPENAWPFRDKRTGKQCHPGLAFSDDSRWSCAHVVRCQVCKKVLDQWLGSRCPDYSIPEDRGGVGVDDARGR